jgi:hypothetical protein
MVWNSHSQQILVHNLLPEQDGVQLTLQTILTPNISDAVFNQILFTLWYIWKARNDFHFNTKQWTFFQVHHAAQAHMNSHAAALLSQVIPPSNTTHQDHHSHQGMTTLPTGYNKT